jgi:glycerol uptake facilitator-like aquaporin
MAASSVGGDKPTSQERANVLRLGLAELIGTFLLVWVGTAVATAATLGK